MTTLEAVLRRIADVDLRALLKVALPEELERARRALALIAARGYHRGRNLEKDFAALVDSSV